MDESTDRADERPLSDPIEQAFQRWAHFIIRHRVVNVRLLLHCRSTPGRWTDGVVTRAGQWPDLIDGAFVVNKKWTRDVPLEIAIGQRPGFRHDLLRRY